jgi:TRAP-type uncharacterized transport system substrate-binding protein
MKKIKLVLALGMCLVLVSAFTLPGSAFAQKKMWRLGTVNPGAYGYRIAGFLSDFLRKAVPEYDVTVYPFANTTATMKSYLVGELETCYSAEPGLRKLYAFQKPFAGFEANVKQMPVQSFWSYTMETFIVTLPENKDKYRSWSDLNGKKIYLSKSGYMNYINIRRAMEDVCGLKVTHVEIDMSKAADALRAGTIDATAAYTTALTSLAGWLKVLDVAMPLQGVNPTPEQIKKLTTAGFTPAKINVKKAFTQDLGVSELYGVPFYFGYHHPLSFPAEDVYRMLKALETGAADLAKLDSGFGPLAADCAGFQVKGIQSFPEMPVHPGLAKYLKEKGLWDSAWVVATEETIQSAIKKMKAKAR